MDTFSRWLKTWDRKLRISKRRILLLLDNAPVHPKTDDIVLTNIRLHYMPKNTTSLIQPCDAGIINSLKCHYKNLLRRRVSAMMEIDENAMAENLSKKISILDSVHLVSEAWRLVKPETIANCFKSAFKGKNLEVQRLYNDIDLPAEFNLETFTMQLDLEIRNRFNDFDEDVDIEALLDNDDITENELENHNDEKSQEDVVSPVEFLHHLSAIRNFVQTNGASDNVYAALSELEKLGLSKKIGESSKQSRITNFFK